MCCRRISQIPHCRSTLCATLSQFARVPNPLESYEQGQRFRHADIDDAPLGELRRELAALRQAVSILASPEPWHFERIERLEWALRNGD